MLESDIMLTQPTGAYSLVMRQCGQMDRSPAALEKIIEWRALGNNWTIGRPLGVDACSLNGRLWIALV